MVSLAGDRQFLRLLSAMKSDRQNVSAKAAVKPLSVELRVTVKAPDGEPGEYTPPELNRSWFDRPWVPEILICAATALVYVATLSFGFVYDDVLQVFKSPALHEWRYLPQYFSSHVLAAIHPGAGGNYYRPLLLLWLRLNYVLFGPEPAGWHATSVLCHVLATFLVFRLAERLGRDRLVAFGAAVLFGIAPSHIESVAWISGVSDPLMTCFVLGSLLLFLEWRSTGKLGAAILSLTLFAGGLLSKETAVVLPALIFAAAIVESPVDNSSRGATNKILVAFRDCAGFAAIAIAYLGLRFWALHGWSHPEIHLSWKQVILTWPSVVWFYARHLVWPVGLSEFYPLDYVSSFTVHGVAQPLLGLCLGGGALALALRFIRECSRSIAGFAVVLMTVPLLPVLDLRALTPGDIVHDRYLYLSSAGFALLVGLLLREVASKGRDSRARVWLPAIAASAVGIAMATLTLSQQTQWASDILLYTHGLQSAPQNLTVRDNLANALMEANQPERALPLYLEVLKRNPSFWRSNYNLGYAYYKTGNFTGAEVYLKRAIQIDPGDPDEYIYLALADLQLAKLGEAAENARHAIALNPGARGYHFVAGLIYERQEAGEQARAEFKTEIEAHPENSAALAELQRLESVQSISHP